jgi:hypothetical protein
MSIKYVFFLKFWFWEVWGGGSSPRAPSPAPWVRPWTTDWNFLVATYKLLHFQVPIH